MNKEDGGVNDGVMEGLTTSGSGDASDDVERTKAAGTSRRRRQAPEEELEDETVVDYLASLVTTSHLPIIHHTDLSLVLQDSSAATVVAPSLVNLPLELHGDGQGHSQTQGHDQGLISRLPRSHSALLTGEERRERRRQSNRRAAERRRQKKRQETEAKEKERELVVAENRALKDEIEQLSATIRHLKRPSPPPSLLQ